MDLSHNQLTEFPDKYFGPPPNLKELYISYNKLHQLPLNELKLLKSKIKIVDLGHNHLAEFHDEFLEFLKNGTRFMYSGKICV